MSATSIPTLLNDVKAKPMTDEQAADLAVELAGKILEVANKSQKASERYQGWKMARMMDDPMGKTLTLAMADQVFRSPSDSRSASQFRYLLDEYGVPTYLPLHEQVAMKMGAISSALAPDLVMPAITWKMRGESSEVILPSEDEKLIPHLKKRKAQGIRMNINQLGEAILGEEEAGKRLDQVVARLESPDCEYISVKISAIFSQINLVAYDDTLDQIKERLRRLYRTALANTFTTEDGLPSPKFVNLDMEEYRDLHLTCDAFKQVLMEDEFLKLRAGIVLQAYLPDSFEVQKDLTAWARERVAQGGGTIKVRIVKGANLAMEEVEASVHDWELAPYSNKADVDANYKRMVHYGCHPDNAKVVQLGIASHNLFEITYAMILRAGNGVEEHVEFEMLEGMANHQARAVRDAVDGLLLYAPVVKKEDFHSAIAYLVRRLDENTAEENFLHDIFGMKKGDASWEKQRKMFLTACKRRDEVSTLPARTQNRATEVNELDLNAPFKNAADTDWSLRHNMRWILKAVEQYRATPIEPIPVQIGGEFEHSEETKVGRDPSCPEKEAYRFSGTDADGIERALQCAADAQPAWEDLGVEERRRILKQVAVEIANARADCITATMLDGGKAAPEADAEVSEAIDFADYYADSLSDEAFFDGTSCKALGTIVVTPPWNFPFAIPCGGVLAALMAGNSVILKPASEAVLSSWQMVQLLWKAGIPKKVLQFVMCADRSSGQKLLTDERCSGVILTGGYPTARMFQGWKPEMKLFAETSGKNALIITSAADPDQAVKDLVKSAFGHAGQKCSAASLAIIEADLYDSPGFMRQLRDAAASLKVGPSSDPASIVTPVIHEPDEDLSRAQTTLDDKENWLLEPKMVDGNPCLWSPGIKKDVAPDSWYRRTECFGPVLGLVRAANLEHAIRIQNDSDFGLTGGIHTLDAREIEIWRDRVEVGNAYINRSITGAIVQRQPFGGWKQSVFGPGAKAGGPNYVSLLADWTQDALPQSLAEPASQVKAVLDQIVAKLPDAKDQLKAAASSCARWWQEEFSVEHDPSHLHGESNHFRYRPFPRILLRSEGMEDVQLAKVLIACVTAGVRVDVSVAKSSAFLVDLGVPVVVESESELIGRLGEDAKQYGILRVLNPSMNLQRAANDAALQTITAPPLANGRLEVLHYLREQAVSETTHRYGNVIPKAKDVLLENANG
ncbi:proline dehydrogenase family protein [Verrucomicrobiaceae bacterium N1E253]|uniref:L-glutamate gamma-semialdehyde dehydrogenase n=1 Tax=Oceaniferula marina TaxID=2748318 RepID=A0A851GG31_9BACT|nr:proline dehydrogenase family protein [Oceaniferula marina]NWK54761.1 proline dehydrogenase family protein [Oceaniferula marina]